MRKNRIDIIIRDFSFLTTFYSLEHSFSIITITCFNAITDKGSVMMNEMTKAY